MENLLPEIRKTVVLNVPIENVWKAVSTAEGIAGWFMPNTLDVARGKEFVLNAGPYGDSRCLITAWDPPHVLGFDWDEHWHLTFKLEPMSDGRTEFTLIHAGWEADKMTALGQPFRVVRGIMDKGWERKVQEGLPAYLEA